MWNSCTVRPPRCLAHSKFKDFPTFWVKNLIKFYQTLITEEKYVLNSCPYLFFLLFKIEWVNRQNLQLKVPSLQALSAVRHNGNWPDTFHLSLKCNSEAALWNRTRVLPSRPLQAHPHKWSPYIRTRLPLGKKFFSNLRTKEVKNSIFKHSLSYIHSDRQSIYAWLLSTTREFFLA